MAIFSKAPPWECERHGHSICLCASAAATPGTAGGASRSCVRNMHAVQHAGLI